MSTPKVAFSKQLETAIKDGRIIPVFKTHSFVGDVTTTLGESTMRLEGNNAFFSMGSEYNRAAANKLSQDFWGFVKGNPEDTTAPHFWCGAQDSSEAGGQELDCGIGIRPSADKISPNLGLLLQGNIDGSDLTCQLVNSSKNPIGTGSVRTRIRAIVNDALSTQEAWVSIEAVSDAASTSRIQFSCTDGVYDFSNVPVHADNTAATGAGMTANQIYRTATGDLKIVY